MNETIFRGAHERVLDMPIFPEAVQHTSTCPHARKQAQDNELLELDEPAITVEITPGGAIVGRGSKQLELASKQLEEEDEPTPQRVCITKTGAIVGAGD